MPKHPMHRVRLGGATDDIGGEMRVIGLKRGDGGYLDVVKTEE
jgi:hypothetical protein